MKRKYNRRHGWTSLRTADAFPVVEKRGPEMRLLFAGYGWTNLKKTESD